MTHYYEQNDSDWSFRFSALMFQVQSHANPCLRANTEGTVVHPEFCIDESMFQRTLHSCKTLSCNNTSFCTFPCTQNMNDNHLDLL